MLFFINYHMLLVVNILIHMATPAMIYTTIMGMGMYILIHTLILCKIFLLDSLFCLELCFFFWLKRL